MPLFELQTPDGEVYEIEATDEAAAEMELEQMQGGDQPQQHQSGGFEEFNKNYQAGKYGAPTAGYPRQFATGIAKGTLGLAELPGAARDFANQGAVWAAGKMGASPEKQEAMTKGFAGAKYLPYPFGGMVGGAPSPGELQPQVEKITGPFPQPQNFGEEIVDRAGTFAPGVAMGPGGILPKVGAWLGSTFGSDAGKRLAEGSPYEPYAEFTGGLLGGAGGLTAVERSAANAAKKSAIESVPNTGQIEQTATQLFKQADKIGLAVKPQGFSDMIDEVFRAAGDDGFFAANHPKLANAFAELEKWRGSPMTLDKLHQIRRNIKSAYDPSNPQQNDVMRTALNKFDDYMENLRPDQVLSGDTRAARILLKEANPTWAKFRKSELFDNITQNAKNAVGANYTEAAFQTAVKQQLRAIAKDDFKRHRYLKPNERQMILDVIEGGKMENFTRKLGKFSVLTGTGALKSSGVGLLANWIGGPPLAAAVAGGLTAAGTVARPVSQSIAKNNFNLLKATVRNGKPIRPLSSPSLLRSQVPIQGLLGLRAGQPGGGGGGQGY